MAESFSREKLRQAPQKEGGWKNVQTSVRSLRMGGAGAVPRVPQGSTRFLCQRPSRYGHLCMQARLLQQGVEVLLPEAEVETKRRFHAL